MPVEWTPVTNAPSTGRSLGKHDPPALLIGYVLYLFHVKHCATGGLILHPRRLRSMSRRRKSVISPAMALFLRAPCAAPACPPPLAFPCPPRRCVPGDIDAAARGVVRVVLIGDTGGEIAPVSHGSGFAVTPPASHHMPMSSARRFRTIRCASGWCRVKAKAARLPAWWRYPRVTIWP